MRRRTSTQTGIDFQAPALPETVEYYAKYERIDEILRDNREFVDLVHQDVKHALEKVNKGKNGRSSRYSSEQVLRTAIAQAMEGESLRNITVRVDESTFLRSFTRIYNDKMMSYTTFCSLRNAIRPETWYRLNRHLARHTIEKDLIAGKKLRVETTAVETNIHYPTDSSLLWDTYRKIASLIRLARELRPGIDDGRRLQDRRAKRLAQEIARKMGKKKRANKPQSLDAVENWYSELISMVAHLLDLAGEVRDKLMGRCPQKQEARLQIMTEPTALSLTIDHYHELGLQVVSQAKRRVLGHEKVPNDKKIFSIFEPHTELLKRGKAGKPIEFGHMVHLSQVERCFVTDYKVFRHKPDESVMLEPIVESHIELFGRPPEVITADKGFYGGMAAIHALEESVAVVSVCKNGRRTQEEEARERSREFKLAQRFRAGIEGTISVLKRCYGMARCLRKGWKHYAAMVGNAIFAHNLCVTARC